MRRRTLLVLTLALAAGAVLGLAYDALVRGFTYIDAQEDAL